MEQIILIAHLLIALAIIGLIMLQQGKGAEMGASFGSGASQTLFGSDGSTNILTRGTAILATAFFATSITLAIMAKNQSSSVEEIDIPVPLTEQVELLEDSDLPVAEDDQMPTLSAEEDIPGVE
jgi:preprotein translocase subunit SecG